MLMWQIVQHIHTQCLYQIWILIALESIVLVINLFNCTLFTKLYPTSVFNLSSI